MPGRLNLDVTVVGNPLDEQAREMNLVNASGSAELTESDLAGTDMVAGMYNLMRGGDRGPTGRGDATFRLEGKTLDLTEFRYFNEGTEIRATLNVQDIWNAPDSPVDGVAFGSLRPLSSVKLPLLADADKIFSVIQKDAVTAKLSNTLRDMKVDAIVFKDASDTLRRMLLRDARSETRGSAQ